MSSPISFEILKEDTWSGARAGILKTPHGEIETPVFMPVGTSAALKAMTFDQVRESGAEIVLSNAYHLFLRPGHELIERAGGLHRFMAWDRPILTDSGGFQVFSLDSLRKISEEGVHFKDHKTGQGHFIGPERSMTIQNALGADIIMAFDDCVKNPATMEEARAAMDRTHRWLSVCEQTHRKPDRQALFGIVQGSTYEILREESVAAVTSIDLPGYAIGGVAVGEDRKNIERIVLHTTPLLPRLKPRYLMGVGTPWDIVFAIRCGIDMFDCVSPTRLARHGAAFFQDSRINLKNAEFREDPAPIDEDCDCRTCATYSRAYLNHLVRQKEMTGAILIAIHNVRSLIRQARLCRTAIMEGRFQEYFSRYSASR